MMTTPAVLADRWIEAPRDLVFRAFTEPGLIEQWFCPSPEVAVRVELCEPHEGGSYRFVYYFPGGKVTPVLGEYLEVSPPARLVFTWTWEEPDPWAGVVTVVTVTLEERGGGTGVHVRHERLLEGDMAIRHQSGWLTTLERLEFYLTHKSGDYTQCP